MITIIKVEESKKEYIDAINLLLDQLSSEKVYFNEHDLLNIINCDSSSLYLMYMEEVIIGMFTLCACLSPTGLKYWLEDVVIDEKYRGQSLGKELVKSAIGQVALKGKSKLMLTSRPERLVANNLYKSLGFEHRNTNVYRMDFK